MDIVAPVSSCVQGAVMSGNHCFAAVLVYPRFLGKNIKYKGLSPDSVARISTVEDKNRGTECTQAGKSPGKVDGGLVRMEGDNLGQMFVELRRGGISIMMFNVGFR